MCRACLAVAMMALSTSAIAAPPAAAVPATFGGASADGGRVFFTTAEQLVPGDTDNRIDVYERSFDSAVGSYVTREVSTGPTGGNDAFDATYDGASADGNEVFFSTEESLVAEDTDRSEDVYMRDISTGTTTLVSQGAAECAPACGNGASPSSFVDVTPAGSKVFFASGERLAQNDTDSAFDVYMRNISTGTTTLVSQGAAECAPACGNGEAAAIFLGTSADGAKVSFTTVEQLTGADEDSSRDIYQRDLVAGTTTLVSISGSCPAAECPPTYAGESSDGSRVFFETDDRISPSDTDASSDVYEWSGGTATPVSTVAGGGNGPANATYQGSSADGADVFFGTSESLSPEDEDEADDVYERSGGATTLISTGPDGGNGAFPASFNRASADGSAVIFTTAESLTASDTDSARDVYERAGGVTTLVSTAAEGGGASDASFAGASTDGTKVFFTTTEPVASSDTDAKRDVYERILPGEAPATLASPGTASCAPAHCGNGEFDASFVGASNDGEHVFFITEERLVEGDLDAETDVYDHSPAGTLLVSTGNSPQLVLGPEPPFLVETDPPSPGSSLTPALLGEVAANTSIKIYATPNCSGVPVATGSSAAFSGAGIPVSVAAGSETTFRATATDANGDTSPCSANSITYRQESESSGGGGGGSEVGGGGGEVEGGSGGPGGGSQPSVGVGSSSAGQVPGGAGHLMPHTRITFAPAFKTRARRPVIRFADATGQTGTTFLCRVDRGHWRGCSSPQKLKRLSYGLHVFRVKGVNSGISETRPVTRRFKVMAG